MISVDEQTCRNLDRAATLEWLETNGLGGFASSTIIGLNTRRYHGLLTAATKPPVGRLVLLSKLEETLLVDDRRHELSVNQYPGAIHPQGLQIQTGFRLDPFPVWTYRVEGIEIEKTVFMVQHENTTVIEYRFKPEDGAAPNGLKNLVFEVRPLIAFRDYHGTTHENTVLNPHVQTSERLAAVKPYDELPTLYLAHNASDIDTAGVWYRNFEYRIEQERGLDYREDLFNPMVLKFAIPIQGSDSRATVIASTEPRDVMNADVHRASEIQRRKYLSTDTDLLNQLMAAAEQFIVSRGEQKTVIAGYHWFADWGRDTMISLPGLTLPSGNIDVAKKVLIEFAKHVDRGMLPNRFPDAGDKPEYNTVDATLWFFEAVRAFVERTSDYSFVKSHLYDVLHDVVEWHSRGTRFNIHVDDDGLLFAGADGVQLTWMDAKVGNWVITPRTGKAVEIQALWYNALRVMESLAVKLNDHTRRKQYRAMASLARKSFNKSFWNEKSGCLFDVVNGEDRDGSIRPNQILAISLANSMVTKSRARSVMQVVERELLTPRGLRTLSSADPRYVGRYEGDPQTRDASYHQGTVWPWLMGSYVSAYIRTFGDAAGRRFAADWLRNFSEHINEACLGQVSEIFDGDAPHLPRGCVAQAWSVAELLRVAAENSLVSRPRTRAASATPQ